ncbi:MAG: NAD(+) diphosphatase [Scrofimicrobium sp.]
MISELPMGRGTVDAMGYERASFTFAGLNGQPWVGHVVDPAGKVLIQNGRLAEVIDGAGEPLLLGRTTDGIVHLVWVVPTEPNAPGTASFVANVPRSSGTDLAPSLALAEATLVPLTQIAAELSADDSQLASRAVALAKWHATFRFCPRCGAPVVPVEAGWASQCTNCGAIEYPRMDPVVIMRVTDAKERLLLASNATWPERRMSLPAGYVEAGETPPQAVDRELWEEVQLRVENTEYLASQVWPGPRSLMLAFSATILGGTADPVPDGVEIREARFFSRRELIRAFDTGEVLGPGPSSIAYAVINDWLGA